jgi:ribonuclease Z
MYFFISGRAHRISQQANSPEGMPMRSFTIGTLTAIALSALAPAAQAAPCLTVTLTGTQGGPTVFNGQAGAGTLVRYGDDINDCSAMKLQFDTGRGTNQRLSRIGVSPPQLNAIFFTHMHGDHTEGFADIMMLRWYLKGSTVDIVCSADAVSTLEINHSCGKFVAHVADAFIESGEIAERRSEDKGRAEGGPAALTKVITFEPKDEPQLVWSSGDVKVSAIRSTHLAGHASYRVDTPAGSVVIGGDASSDTPAPPRAHSTSDQVEKLAKGADIIVHSTMHPVLGPDRGSGFPAPSFYRQSLASDLGAMAQRDGAKYLMLTHLAPALGTARHNQWDVPGGPLTEADYRAATKAGGFTGITIVGTDLASLRLPAK